MSLIMNFDDVPDNEIKQANPKNATYYYCKDTLGNALSLCMRNSSGAESEAHKLWSLTTTLVKCTDLYTLVDCQVWAKCKGRVLYTPDQRSYELPLKF